MAVDWLKIKTEYLKEQKTSLRDVAAKHKVNPSYLMYVAARDGWKKEKDEAHAKAEQKLSERMPETIAEVKLRHARIGRNLQSSGLIAIIGDERNGLKPLRPKSYGEATLAVTKGVLLERQALGMNEKEVQDEVYQKFSQFTFIFSLSKDELLNFIRSALSRGSTQGGNVGTAIPAVAGEDAGSQSMGSAPVSG